MPPLSTVSGTGFSGILQAKVDALPPLLSICNFPDHSPDFVSAWLSSFQQHRTPVDVDTSSSMVP